MKQLGVRRIFSVDLEEFLTKGFDGSAVGCPIREACRRRSSLPVAVTRGGVPERLEVDAFMSLNRQDPEFADRFPNFFAEGLNLVPGLPKGAVLRKGTYLPCARLFDGHNFCEAIELLRFLLPDPL